ncbi:hypothetical protein R6Q59_004936 [Mikania micrantha]
MECASDQIWQEYGDLATKVRNRSVGAAIVVVDWVSAAPVGAADGRGRRDESRSGWCGGGARSVTIGSAVSGGARSE